MQLRSLEETEKAIECPLCAFAMSLISTKHPSPVQTSAAEGWARKDLYIWAEVDNDEGPSFGLTVGPQPWYTYNFSPPNTLERIPNRHFVVKLGDFDVIPESHNVASRRCHRNRIKTVVDYNRLEDWISTCRDTHEHQPVASISKKILRSLIANANLQMIDVQTLVVHSVCSLELPRYAASSYTWGSGGPIEEHSPGADDVGRLLLQSRSLINLDALPQTLREAILLVRSLGIPYLWVDQLCINQTPGPRKSQIIASMGAIYASAELVLAAAAGTDAEAGLPGSAPHPRREEDTLCRAFTASGSQIEVLKRRGGPERGLQDVHWLSRAWTFQEYAFAQRVLLVLPDEMYFICETSLRREAYSAHEPVSRPLVRELYLGSMPMHALRQIMRNADNYDWKAYAETVSEYSERSLTLERDRLNAFAGIVDQTDHDDIVALRTGIPMRFFGPGIAWDIAEWAVCDLRPTVASIAPSWSWVSARCPARYNFLEHQVMFYPTEEIHRDANQAAYAISYEPSPLSAGSVVGRPYLPFWENYRWHQAGLQALPH